MAHLSLLVLSLCPRCLSKERNLELSLTEGKSRPLGGNLELCEIPHVPIYQGFIGPDPSGLTNLPDKLPLDYNAPNSPNQYPFSSTLTDLLRFLLQLHAPYYFVYPVPKGLVWGFLS